jgi:hypothetical protein
LETEPELPDVKFAEWPQRKCRQPITTDGLIDHWCDLPELHPGPCCPKSLASAIRRRQQWESVNSGWEKLARQDDPFADVTKDLEGR